VQAVSATRGDPADAVRELDALLAAQQRVVARRQLTGLITDDALDHLVERGQWQRAAWGVVVAHNGPVSRTQRHWAAYLAAGEDAVLAGATAAALDGLPGYDHGEIHLLLPAHRRVRDRGLAPALGTRLVIHRTAVLSDADVDATARPPRTVLARSILDAVAWADGDEEARAFAAAALASRRVPVDELAAVLSRMPRSRRRGLLAAAVRDAAPSP
jgi:hypothetical protein